MPPTGDQTDVAVLLPKHKIYAIVAANAAIYIFVLVCQKWGYGTEAPGTSPTDLKPDLTTYFTWQVATLLVCALPGTLSLGDSFLRSLRRQRERTDGPIWQLLNDNDDAASKFFRVSITILTYISITALVLNSGGVIEGPFGQFPIALVVLAPVIMTSRVTLLTNLILGAPYVAVVFYVSSDTTSDVVTALSDQLAIHPWVFSLEAVIVVLVGLGFTVLARWTEELESM